MNKITYAQIVFFLSCFLSCKDTEVREKEISLERLKKIILKENDCTSVDVLQIFPIKNKCTGKIESASLYVCRIIDTQDTLYVFDVCNDVSSSIDKDFKDGFCIMKKNVKDFGDNKVLKVFTPDNFNISNGSKYLCGRITMLVD